MMSNKDNGTYLLMSKCDIDDILHSKKIRVVSIDPGSKNLAISMETRYKRKRKSKYCNRIVTYGIYLAEFESKTSKNDCGIYRKMKKYLDTFIDFIKKVDIVFVEAQMPNAYLPLRISQHLITYFMMVCKEDAAIVQISTQMKAKYLGCRLKKDLKKASVSKCQELLAKREDDGMSMFNTGKSRRHDKADTIVQSEAFFVFFQLGMSMK